MFNTLLCPYLLTIEIRDPRRGDENIRKTF